MTFNQFVNQYNGKAIDYDRADIGVQCVDLVKLFIDKVLLIKPCSIGNANCYYDDFYSHDFLKQNFERIPNTPSFVPKKR